MNDEFDKELADGLLEVPAGFEQRVMARINREPAPDTRSAGSGRRWLEWLALGASAVIGLTQLAGFMFGVWSTVSLP